MTKSELIEQLKSVSGQGNVRSSLVADSPPGRGISGSSQENEERLRAILETAVEGIITIDHTGIIETFNPAAERIFGYRSSEVIGKNISVLMPAPYRSKHDGYIANYLRTGEARIIGIGREVTGRRRDGNVFPMELSVSEVRLEDRLLFTGFVRDVSERFKAEAKLVESEERYRRLIESTHDLIFSIKPDGHFEYVNRAWLETLGYIEKQVRRMTHEDIIHPECLVPWRGIHSEAMRGVNQNNVETMFLTVRGKAIVVEGNVTAQIVDRELVAIHGFFRDITQRRELEKEILEIRHWERQRIGQELHDNLGQQLTGIEFMSQTLEQKLVKENSAHAPNASTIAGLVRQAISHTRGLSRGLNPVELESEGLMTALQELAEQTGSLFGIASVFRCDPPVLIEDNSVATHLFRIAQEAVNNAVKHGKPKEIDISLSEDESMIILAVRDNGKGIAKKPVTKRGMGLKIMNYRVGLIGGSLTVQKGDRRGTEVVCTIHKQRIEPTSNHHERATDTE